MKIVFKISKMFKICRNLRQNACYVNHSSNWTLNEIVRKNVKIKLNNWQSTRWRQQHSMFIINTSSFFVFQLSFVIFQFFFHHNFISHQKNFHTLQFYRLIVMTFWFLLFSIFNNFLLYFNIYFICNNIYFCQIAIYY